MRIRFLLCVSFGHASSVSFSPFPQCMTVQCPLSDIMSLWTLTSFVLFTYLLTYSVEAMSLSCIVFQLSLCWRCNCRKTQSDNCACNPDPYFLTNRCFLTWEYRWRSVVTSTASTKICYVTLTSTDTRQKPTTSSSATTLTGLFSTVLLGVAYAGGLGVKHRLWIKQARMYYGPGKGVRNSCNSWLLQLLYALTPYAVQSLHANLFYL